MRHFKRVPQGTYLAALSGKLPARVWGVNVTNTLRNNNHLTNSLVILRNKQINKQNTFFSSLFVYFCRKNLAFVDIFYGDMEIESITEQKEYEIFQFICKYSCTSCENVNYSHYTFLRPFAFHVLWIPHQWDQLFLLLLNIAYIQGFNDSQLTKMEKWIPYISLSLN